MRSMMTRDSIRSTCFFFHSSFVIRYSSFRAKSRIFPITVIVTVLGFVSTSFGQQRPLRTADLELVPFGSVRVDFGLEFLQKQKYSLSGLEGDLSRLGI